MRRMTIFSEMYAGLKSFFVDKTNTGTETMIGSLSAAKLVAQIGATKTAVKDLGTVASTDLLRAKIVAGESGLYTFFVGDFTNRPCAMLIKFNADNSSLSVFAFQELSLGVAQQNLVLSMAADFSSATFASILASTSINKIPILFSDVTAINANISSTPKCGIENSNLHIRGVIAVIGNIPAGSKLFNVNQILIAQMTDESAINTGPAASATFVGISIDTNGNVYNLSALASGTTYNISVTATI